MNADVSNYSWGLPVEASTYAAKLDWSLLVLHGVMIAIFVLWAIYMAYCLVRYRSSKSPAAVYSHKSPLSAYIPDVLIFFFEIWLIFIVGIPIWAHLREDLPKTENATVLAVTAEQFAWIADYPGADGLFAKRDPSLVHMKNPLGLDFNDPAAADDVVSVNEIAVPLGKPVLIYLTSMDVIHSFFVPEFRIKQDAVPGMKIPLWFEPTIEGKFELSCAQLCGAGHYRMRGDVLVLNEADYQRWLETKTAEMARLKKAR